MKKFLQRLIPLMLSAVVMLTTVGCGGPELIEQIDDTKTTLKVYNYSGGVGTEWFKPVKERFEKAFENYSFEPGKKGVQIMPDETKTDTSLQTIQQNENHVFFAEWVDAVSLIGNDNTLQIHDVLTTPLNEFLVDETGKSVTDDPATIESKLYDETKHFFTFREEKYYGLPHYSHFPAIIYNHQLFEDKGLFFADTPVNNTLEGNFVSKSNPTKSCGPDGQMGSKDDGLPATWDEMFLLYDRMIQRGVTPFVWNGEGAKGYTKYFLSNAYLNLVGKDVARYNYDYNSGDNTINIITRFNNDGSYETGVAKILSEADKNLLHSELEKYYALEAFDRMLDNESYYTEDCRKGLGTNLDAQYDFVLSYCENKPIGMLLEGSYWYNEAEDAGHLDAGRYSFPDEFDEMNDFRIMYMPHRYNGRASDIKGTDMGNFVLTDQSDSFACINKTIEGNEGLVKCAKMFLAFCYTQESLEEFTVISDTVRFMNYDVDTSKLSDYGKHIWNIVKEADVLLPYSRHNGYLSDKRKFTMHIEGTFFEYNADRPYDLLRGGTKTVVNYFKNYMAQDNK